MDEVLLGKLHKEISVEFDIEIEIASGSFGLLNVEVKCSIEEPDCLCLVTFETPFNLGFKESMI